MRKTSTLPPVPPDEFLWRRTYNHPVLKYLNPDGTPTSRAFKLRPKDEGKLSVDVKSLSTPEKSVLDAERFFLFELPNRALLAIGLESFFDPLTLAEHGIENAAHAYIWGLQEDDDTKPGLLARQSRILFPS
ncbi:MAG: hypothetical protein AAB316_05100 [Bacteroidota bacterium]